MTQEPAALLLPGQDQSGAPQRPRRKKSIEGMFFQQLPDNSYVLVPVTDDQVAGADREMLSISVAHAVNNCPAAHLAKQNLPRVSDPFAANELGSAPHDILEHVYRLPRGSRNDEAFDRYTDQVTEQVWSQKKLIEQYPPSIEENQQLRRQWREVIENWAKRIRLLEDPDDIDVIGTEIELDGTSTSNGVLSTGKIDRLEREPSGFLTIVDYKFGEWKGEPDPKWKDNYKEQQYLYLDLYWQATGERPQGMQILYPRHPHRRIIAFNEAEYQQTLANFKSSRDTLSKHVEEKAFPAKPGGLCAYCELARSCPASKVKTVAEFDPFGGKPLASMPEWKRGKRIKAIKANATARSKPSAADLGIRVLDATGRDCGVNDDTRFYSPEPTSYAPERHPEENPGMVTQPSSQSEAPPRIPTGEGLVQRVPELIQKGSTMIATQEAQSPVMAPMRAEGSPQTEVVNGALNLNSYAARPIADMVEYSFWLLRECKQQLDEKTLRALSSTLSRITANVLYKSTGLRSMQSGAAGHAHKFVKSTTKEILPPFGGDASAWASWGAQVELFAATMMRQIDTSYGAAQPDAINAEGLSVTFPASVQQPY